MTEKTAKSDQPDRPNPTDLPDDDQDTEGHSLLMYEQARMVVRERERDVQNHAREARLRDERKRQKR